VIELLLQAERALSVGLVDQADRLYRQAVDADPRNAIAVVGLARVALERSDDRAAYALGLRALEIDPDNQAAQRLVERMGEVLRYRGEQPPQVAAELPVSAGDRSMPGLAPPADFGPAPSPQVASEREPTPASPARSRARRPGLLRRLLGRDT
jgi:tetratricopeptide (TPR) repeat protein